MSRTLQLLNITPESHNKENEPEVKSYSDFECPSCNGKGFFNHSGWAAKFKKDLDDPDFVECTRCAGTGKLQAKVVIKWMPEDLPSKCPENVYDS